MIAGIGVVMLVQIPVQANVRAVRATVMEIAWEIVKTRVKEAVTNHAVEVVMIRVLVARNNN